MQHANGLVECIALKSGGVAELAYAADLKSAAARLQGSSPCTPTKKEFK